MAEPFVLVPAPDPMIGRVIDRFVVRTVLGRGGMGAVYLAQHEASPHVRCVIKTMLAHVANNAMMIGRFKIETDAVSRVKHDNIVRLENFGVLDDGQLFMRFEFIDGKPLDRYLAEHGGRLSLHRAAYLAFQVCDALDYAHTVGVVHRDLKPDNLLIVVDRAVRVPQLVKVVDFGISKVVRTGEVQTGSGMSMGTPYFMAVEQYANAAEATAKADVFSLAVIIWLMVTGDLPWGRPDPTVLYHLQRTVVPARPPEDVMSSAVATILLECFAVDPEDRPCMRELAVALASAIPATERAPSGADILMDLVPRFVVSAPDFVQTFRHTVVRPDRVAAQLWPQLETDAARRDGRGPPADTASSSLTSERPLEPAQAVAPDAVHPIVSNPPSLAIQAVEAVHPPLPVQAATSQQRARGVVAFAGRSPSPHIAAALPTGLTSAEFVAVQPLQHGPVPSIVAASEFVAPVGTPGPQPYAHAELPPVVVSTQLSKVSQPARVSNASFRRARLVLLVAGAGLLAAAVTFTAAHLGVRAKAGTTSSQTASTHDPPVDPVPSDLAASSGGVVQVSDAGSVTSAAPDVAMPAAPRSTASAASAASAAGPSQAIGRGLTEPPAETRAATKDSRGSSFIDTRATAASSPAGQSADGTHASPPRSKSTPPATSPAAAPSIVKAEGELVISVRPWAAVWLNGRSIPDGTPYRAQLPVGRYRVRLANEDVGQSESLTIVVEPHKTTTIERKW